MEKRVRGRAIFTSHSKRFLLVQLVCIFNSADKQLRIQGVSFIIRNLMRYILSLFITLAYFRDICAQKISDAPEILTTQQSSEIFTAAVCKTLDINFPIIRVYSYADKAGKYYCVLTENISDITYKDDTLYRDIKAINFKYDGKSFSKLWEINDHIIREGNDEHSIWFWTKYIDIRDYDGDGLADPVIVYGASADEEFWNSRVKFIICYKGQKIAIRHQNADLDFHRATQVDKAFHSLPQPLQEVIIKKMEQMVENGHSIFSPGWQTAMKNGKTWIVQRP